VTVLSGNTGSKIIGGLGILLFGAATVMLLVRLVRPRDLLRADAVGMEQLAFRPHVTIAWADITDIAVIKRDHGVRTIGITVRDPSQLPRRARFLDVTKARSVGRLFKVLFAGVQLLAEGPAGTADAIDTLRADFDPKATFEIATLGWPIGTEEAVELLRTRWIGAAATR
jgi:hypothetical protein